MKKVETVYRGPAAPFVTVIEKITGLSAEEAATLIAMGGAYLGKPRCKDPARPVRRGDRIAAYYRYPLVIEPVAFDPAWVLWEGKGLMIAAKPAGMPTQGRRDADYMAFYEILRKNLPGYLGLHHRLDQGTSGLMLFTRDRARNAAVGDLFRERAITKEYAAVVKGTWQGPDTLRIDAPIGTERGKNGTRHRVMRSGLDAVTGVVRIASHEDLHLLSVRPETGRTHQIRVHLHHQGLPLLGDSFYDGAPHPRFYLHCRALSWPARGDLPAGDHCHPIPEDWWETLPAPLAEEAAARWGSARC